jgi:hypothetical protein
MTCPAGWREAAVRRYVEAEFSGVGARVFRAYVHLPPPGAARGAAAVADVYLDYSMGRPKLGNAMSAMLAAPPRAVEDGAGGSVSIRFSTGAADALGGGGATDAAATAANASRLPQASVGTSSPRAHAQQALLSEAGADQSSGSASASWPGAPFAGGPSSAADNAGATIAPPELEALAAGAGNKISMTCPRGWSEDSVRRYVEAEFGGVGARVHSARVHARPPGSSPCVTVAADVYLDCRMAKPKLAEAIAAMLAAPPKVVDYGAGGIAIISFGPTVRFVYYLTVCLSGPSQAPWVPPWLSSLLGHLCSATLS